MNHTRTHLRPRRNRPPSPLSRRLRAPAVSLLACAVLLAGLLAAPGASAQSSDITTPTANADGSDTLWTATMTVGEFGTDYILGYDRRDSTGSLSPDTFTIGSTDYPVTSLGHDIYSTTRKLIFSQLDSGFPAERTDWVLYLDGVAFRGSDNYLPSVLTTMQWNNPSLNWTAGQTVAVRLVRLNEPSAPRNLTASAASATSIRLDWSAPAKNGGSDVTGYKIEVSTDGGFSWSNLVADTSSTDTTYSHTGLTANDTRHYRVSAINAIGTGLVSNTASVTITPPGAPRGLKTTPGDRAVSLAWNAAPDGGSNSITKYQVRHIRSTLIISTATWTDVTGGAGARTHTVTGLTNNTEYAFEVRAVNGVGAGTAGTVKATPKRPAAVLTYRFHVRNYSITRGSNKVGEHRTGGYVGVLRDDDPDTLEGGETVESDTTFTLTWNGRPADELHPDNPTSVTIKAGQRGARFFLKAAADADDPRVYNQPVKANVVVTLGSVTLSDQLVVFDDEPLPVVSVSVPETVEEGAAFRVRATLAHRLDVATNVPIVVENPSEMTLLGINGPYPSISIPAGQLYGETGDIRKQDDNDEDGYGDLYVSVNGISPYQWWPSSKKAKVRVTDDDTTDQDLRRYAGTPRIFTACTSATEGSGANTVTKMPITVFMYPTTRTTVTVDYRTVDGTAKSGVNYTGRSGTLTFGRREKTKTIEVDILDDGVGGHTRFGLVLENPAGGGAEAQPHPATCVIYDEKPTLVTYDESAHESGDGTATDMTFTVSLSFADENATYTVDYATADGAARAGSDYTATSGTLTFAPGERTKEVSVPVIDDEIQDSGETFSLILSNPTGGAQLHAWKATRTGTILNTDPAGALTATFPESRFASASHKGADDRPQVVVAFSEAVTGVSADTPSVAVTGASIASVQAHTEEGIENAWVFFLDPEGEGDVTFALAADAACASGGICTAGGTPLTQAPGAITRSRSPAAASRAPAARRRPRTWGGRSPSSPRATRTLPSPYRRQWCNASDAICTSGETPLTAVPAALTIPGPDDGNTDGGADDVTDLTASFSAVPGEHAGPGEEFTFELTFSEALSLSYVTLRDHAFTVSGADVKKSQRITQGSNQNWTITVEPDGWGDVAISLPGGRACTAAGGICTDDNRMLSNSPSATVQGPVAISVADARVQENGGETLDFAVTLSRAAAGTVTVQYATSNGSATAGADYTATSGMLTFAAGETRKTVSVAVLNDAHDDGGETLILALSNPTGARIADGTATGTIENTDPLQRAWLARFGRAVAGHVMDAVGARIDGRSPASAQLTLGGRQVLLGAAWPAEEGALPASWTKAGGISTVGIDPAAGSGAGLGREGNDSPAQEVSMSGFLLSSSFHMASAEGEGASGRWSMWGRGSRSSFSGTDGALTLDGDVTTGLVGADYESGRVLMGVALAWSAGSGSYAMADAKGELESTLASVHPYLRYTVSERLSVWAVLGLGEGELKLEMEDTGERRETDLSMGMAALGVRGALASWAGLDLAWKGDVLLVRTESDAVTGLAAGDAKTRRLRLALEGSREMKLDAGVLRPSLEVGFRHDGGDAETGSGIELGGALRFAGAGGLTVEVRARGLLAHEEHDYEEWGVSASVLFSPGSDGRGLSVRAGSSWGAASGGTARLWSQRTAAGLVREGDFEPDAASFEAEVGYGLDYLGGLLTPYTGLTVGENGETYRAGGRFRLGESLTMSLEGEHREKDAGAPTHGVALKGSLRW